MDSILSLAALIQGTWIEGTWHRLTDLGSPYSIYSQIGAVVVIGLVFFRRRRARGLGMKRFFASVFSNRIWQHPSTRLDMWMYLMNFVLLAAAYGSITLTSHFWFTQAQPLISSVSGAPWFPGSPIWVIVITTALVEVMLVDFGYWVAHYAMHRTQTLWEFHKVHHSAEVMTVLTEMRQHPVEMIFFPNVIALMIGVGYALLIQVFGKAQPLSLLGVNMFLLAFFVTISHLRHTHVWLPFTGWLGHLIHSPAHHQIHHSTQPKHHGRNLGFALSIWDWAFGTLWVPARRERVEFGIGKEEQADFQTMEQNLTLPVVKAAGHMRTALAKMLPAARKPRVETSA
jgi:sterol desaturase/sphingolipid hydroxylase (fatty acid hydroxylase superfamily)